MKVKSIAINESIDTNEKTMWTAVYGGDNDTVMELFKNGADLNKGYYKFGVKHSYIMGAFRNNNIDTVKLLISLGATIEPQETAEFAERLGLK